jgi:hypothetical protein
MRSDVEKKEGRLRDESQLVDEEQQQKRSERIETLEGATIM